MQVPLNPLDRAVSGARFLTGGVFKCRCHCSSSICCRTLTLYKIRCNPMHLLYGALPGQYVPVRVTCGALVVHRYTYSTPRCRYRRSFISLSAQCPCETILLTLYRRTFISLSAQCPCETILLTLCSMAWDLRGFKSRPNAFLLA